MKFHKRRKARRLRGSHTHARGFKKKARGSGHRGGYGMAGTGKRGDQKKTLVLTLFGNDYFGKDRTLRKGKQFPKLQVINVGDINHKIDSYVSQGKAKESSGSYTLDLTGYKILAEGTIDRKITITASSASKGAMDKVSKAGGSINLIAKSDETKPKKVVPKTDSKEVSKKETKAPKAAKK